MKQRNLFGAVVRGAAALAVCGGVTVAGAGVASATGSTASSVSDCRDYMARWGIDDGSPAEWDVRQACRRGAHPTGGATCEQLMVQAIHHHNSSLYYWDGPVDYQHADVACERAE